LPINIIDANNNNPHEDFLSLNISFRYFFLESKNTTEIKLAIRKRTQVRVMGSSTSSATFNAGAKVDQASIVVDASISPSFQLPVVVCLFIRFSFSRSSTRVCIVTYKRPQYGAWIMKKQLLILIFTSFLVSGCASQSYSAAGGGVYVGNSGYSQSSLSFGTSYSSSAGWYGYPWFSAAYRRPAYPGYWPGYITAGYGSGGFYGGFNWNWGYFYPSPYYAYSGWGYNPYYGYRYSGYRPHRRHGPYRQVHNPRAGYAHAPYRNNPRHHNNNQQHGNYAGHEYDRRDRNPHAGNGNGKHAYPRESIQPVIRQPVVHQPVRVIRLPAHSPEASQQTHRSGRAAASVRSGSGKSNWKGEQPPRQQLHQSTVKNSKPETHRSVKSVRTVARVVEQDAGYTPPRPYSAQRSASGPGQLKKGKSPRQRLHSGSIKTPVQATLAQQAPKKHGVVEQVARPQTHAQPKQKKSAHKTSKSHKSNTGKRHRKERKSKNKH